MYSYEPFVEVCLAADKPHEAAKYIAKCLEYDYKVEAYVGIEYWKEAADVCFREKDYGMLEQVPIILLSFWLTDNVYEQARQKNRQDAQYIEGLLAQVAR